MLHTSLVPRLATLGVLFAAASSCSPPHDTIPEDADLADGMEAAAPVCDGDEDCDDLIACTINHCEEGLCVHIPCLDCCPKGWECVVDFGCGMAPTPCTTDDECVDSTACTLDRCRDATYCEHLPQNGLCDEGEICLAALGCIPTPPTECDVDEDCDMGRPCLGQWYCDPEFACQFLSLVECADDDDCTDDLCIDEEGGCVHRTRDADEDGYGDADCGGDDCDDSNPDIHPGATELCNEVDDDCDGDIDEGCCEETSCTTSCGSTGTTTCPDGDCLPPAETCNGADDDCDGVADNGFACALGVVGTCPTTCGSTGSRTCQGDCTWDDCVPPAETCNGVDDDCDGVADDDFTCARDETESCTLARHGSWFAGLAACEDDCSGWDLSACTNCGDGTRDADEQCDGTDFGGDDCTDYSDFGGGTLQCGTGCRVDTSLCHRCGNGVIDAAEGEDCDGSELGGATCATVGGPFDTGSLSCRFDCTYLTSGCVLFDPTGDYTLDRTVSYSCAYGFFGFSFSSLHFSDTGATLDVTGGHTPMEGSSATDGHIDVSGEVLGGCNEYYTLTGDFTSETEWTGEFRVTFASGTGSCYDCTSQSWTVTGTLD